MRWLRPLGICHKTILPSVRTNKSSPHPHSIMAVPALISFYFLWVISMLLRPLFILSVGLLLWNFPSTVLKFKQVVNTLAYMFFTNDKKYKKLPEVDMEDFKKVRSSVGRGKRR